MKQGAIRKWLACLLTLNFFLALAVVYGSHLSRVQQKQMESLKRMEDTLHLSHKQLLIEQGAWLNLSAIQKKAETELGMYLPDPSEIVFINQ